MRAARLVARGFRNLADTELAFPATGVALIGANGQGKTNLLEALAYPVLFRSLRGARDRDVARFGGPGFHLGLGRDDGLTIEVTWHAADGRKSVLVGETSEPRLTGALGHWLAVAFLPTDMALIEGGAAERRRWVDRLLSLADPTYLSALLRYRAAVAQRGAALRRGDTASAAAFDGALARSGAQVVAGRHRWVETAGPAWRAELERLGEPLDVGLRYRGDGSLGDPAAWSERLAGSRERDLSRGQTHVGPHRDDLALDLGGHPLRRFGSTGQQRTAAIGLRLLEHATLRAARSTAPAVLVDDVFAELDAVRQRRLAIRLGELGAQLVVTAPRGADLPEDLEVVRWQVVDGHIQSA
jgi:DNA replication and repair protein RecF